MAMCTQAVVSCVSVASSSILYMFFSSRSALFHPPPNLQHPFQWQWRQRMQGVAA